MSPLAHTPLEDIRRQFEVNVVGQVAVTQVRAEPLLTFIRVCVRLGPYPTLHLHGALQHCNNSRLCDFSDFSTSKYGKSLH